MRNATNIEENIILLWGRLQEKRTGVGLLIFFTLWLEGFLLWTVLKNIERKNWHIHFKCRSGMSVSEDEPCVLQLKHDTKWLFSIVFEETFVPYVNLRVKRVCRLMFHYGWNDTIPTSTWLKWHHVFKRGANAENTWEVLLQKTMKINLFRRDVYRCLGREFFERPRTLTAVVRNGWYRHA